MRFSTLDQWLSWQETLHPNAIDLGLERVMQVLERLELTNPSFTVITVAGTNGKGSSVAMLQSILLECGFHTGVYTSPHLLKYNERIMINEQQVADDTLCQSFERIDRARGEISLTYFEFGTLAAIDILQRAGVEIAVLEVGLGGRLDAVNVLDADVALITAIDVDHENWLGNDRETIAREKAGILRKGKPAICSDENVPASLKNYAQEVGAKLYLLGRDFLVEKLDDQWCWRGVKGQELCLPFPSLPGQFQVNNAAGVLAVLEQLGEKIPDLASINDEKRVRGLMKTRLPGRFQVIPGEPVQILDVAHNPQSAQALAENLSQIPCKGQTRAVLAMLSDKDIKGVIDSMKREVDQWYLASLDVPRGASAQQLEAELADQATKRFDNPISAFEAARRESNTDDRIVVFGSFYTVAAALSETV